MDVKLSVWLIKKDVNYNWDTYDSAVVIALTEDDARFIHPDGRADWDGLCGDYDSWCDADDVQVTLVGTALEGSKAGVVCASYKAG